jgi:hypothetical protein
VVTLVGIRRSGKTYLLYDTMKRFVARGIDRRRLLHLNFEDDRLLPIPSGEFDLILRATKSYFGKRLTAAPFSPREPAVRRSSR